jgi:predicted flap endonuclease-1-like 5' DNA nuclease
MVANERKKPAKSVSATGTASTKHPVLGSVFARTPKSPDDLRQIRGLGPTFEKRLHELGIYQYSQIMKWKTSQVDEIAKLVGTTDRLISAWIEEAAKLRQGE